MDRLEFLTDYLHRFNEDTLHLVGIGLGMLGTLVGMWAAFKTARHMKVNEKLHKQSTAFAEFLRNLEFEKNDPIKMDPKLDYKVHRVSGGNFLTLRIELSQLGISKVCVTSLVIDVEVLPTDGSSLLLNGSNHLALNVHSKTDDGRAVTDCDEGVTDVDLDTIIDVADENPDGISSIPDEFATWKGLMGFFRHGRTKEVDIPIQTTGSGMFCFKLQLGVRRLRWDVNQFDGEYGPFFVGGETLVGSVNEGPL